MVVCFVLALALLLGLSWVNAFEDAQAPGESQQEFGKSDKRLDIELQNSCLGKQSGELLR